MRSYITDQSFIEIPWAIPNIALEANLALYGVNGVWGYMGKCGVKFLGSVGMLGQSFITFAPNTFSSRVSLGQQTLKSILVINGYLVDNVACPFIAKPKEIQPTNYISIESLFIGEFKYGNHFSFPLSCKNLIFLSRAWVINGNLHYQVVVISEPGSTGALI